MDFDRLASPERRTDPKEAYKAALYVQTQKLIDSRVALKDMAEALDGEEFLSFDEKKQSYSFNIKEFVEKSAQEKYHIRLPDNLIVISETMVPPDSEAMIVTGSGIGMEPKETIHRSIFLRELMEEMNLNYDEIVGVNDPRMVRKLSYRAFAIKSMDRTILVNDEEGNISFVVFSCPLTLDDVRVLATSFTKDGFKDRLDTEIVMYTGDPFSWQQKIKEIILQAKPEKEKANKPDGYWQSISMEELIEEIKRRGFDPKNIPGVHVLMHGNSSLAAGLVGRFGSINNARVELGGEVIKKPNGYWQNISLNELKEEIKRRGFDPENLPSASGPKFRHGNSDLAAGLIARFGNFNKAREAFGGKLTRRFDGYWQNTTFNEIWVEIKRRGLDPSNLPSFAVLARQGHSDLTTGLQKRFGSYEKARMALGSKTLSRPDGFWQKASEEVLLEEVRKAGIDPMNLPSSQIFVGKYHYLLDGLRSRFGDYKKARVGLREIAQKMTQGEVGKDK